mgnify:CR=1 FL=1
MKSQFLIIFALVSLVTSISMSASNYTLPEICAKYSDDFNNCQRIPFCQAARIPARPEGCHARPGLEYNEALCVSFSASQCNPVVTACQYYSATKAQVYCAATRDWL